MYKRILVPLDGSKQSEEILPLVRTLATVYQAEVVLLRVTEYPYALYASCDEYPPADPKLAKIIQDRKEDFYYEARAYLEQITALLTADGIHAATQLCEGAVVPAILENVARHHSDLIAMSTCGQDQCDQCMMGSVSHQILHESPVPVILIRPTTFAHDLSLPSEQHEDGSIHKED